MIFKLGLKFIKHINTIKMRSILLITFFSLVFMASGQESITSKKYNRLKDSYSWGVGHIILTDSSRKEGLIKFHGNPAKYYSVVNFMSKTGVRQTISTDHIYEYELGNTLYRRVNDAMFSIKYEGKNVMLLTRVRRLYVGNFL